MKNWIFYGNERGTSLKVIHFVKQCMSPGRTKEYKRMMELLERDVYETVGYCTAAKWNEEHNLIKVANI